MHEEMRLTDLVPRRLIVYPLWLVGGVALIGGLVALHLSLPNIVAWLKVDRVPGADLVGPGSLGAWFSGLVLQMSGLIAVLVYMIRRHRVDDYHGQYRIWLWAALCWFVLSACQATRGHEAFRDAMIRLTGARLLADGSAWWIIAGAFLFGGVGLRLFVEMRGSWLSFASLLLATVAYGTALTARFNGLPATLPVARELIQATAELLGHWLVLMTMLLHCRYVILDVEGLLAPPKAKSARKSTKRAPKSAKTESEEEEESPADTSARLEQIPVVRTSPQWKPAQPAHPTPPPAAAPIFTPVPDSTASSSDEDEEDDDSVPETTSGGRKLTKGERKALRKRLEDAKRAREAKR